MFSSRKVLVSFILLCGCHFPFSVWSWKTSFATDRNHYKGIVWNDKDFSHSVHGNEWVRMNISELSSYYSLYEQCFLSSSPIELDICDDYPGNYGDCNVGSVGVANTRGGCLNMDGYFYRHKSTKPWPENGNIVDMIKLMKERGSNTLIVMGDSVAGQFVSDTRCSITRYGLSSQFHPLPGSYRGTTQQFSFALYSAGTNQSSSDIPLFQLILERLDFVKVEESVMAALNETLKSPYTKGKLMIIVNIGLHYNEPNKLDDAIRQLFPPLLRLAAAGHTVMFRETSAQHFHTATGQYNRRHKPYHFPVKPRTSPISTVASRSGLLDTDSHAASSSATAADNQADTSHVAAVEESNEIYDEFRCFPIANETMAQAQNFRNRMVAEYLQRHDPAGAIAIIPFFNITAARYDFHFISHYQTDCTHYCHGPLLWEPVWNFVVNHVRNRTGNKRTIAVSGQRASSPR